MKIKLTESQLKIVLKEVGGYDSPEVMATHAGPLHSIINGNTMELLMLVSKLASTVRFHHRFVYKVQNYTNGYNSNCLSIITTYYLHRFSFVDVAVIIIYSWFNSMVGKGISPSTSAFHYRKYEKAGLPFSPFLPFSFFYDFKSKSLDNAHFLKRSAKTRRQVFLSLSFLSFLSFFFSFFLSY